MGAQEEVFAHAGREIVKWFFVILMLLAVILAGVLGWMLHKPETRVVTEIQYMLGRTDTIPGEVRWRTRIVTSLVRDSLWADSIVAAMVRDQFIAAWVLGKATEGVEQEGTWSDTAVVEVEDSLAIVPMHGSFRWGYTVDTTLAKNFSPPMIRVDSVNVPVLIRTVYETETDWILTLIIALITFTAGALAL